MEDNTVSQETKEQVERNHEESNEISEEPKFDYRKAREERLIKSTEKRILKELGEDSFESIKNKLLAKVELEKELKNQIDNGRKLKVYSEGFDDKFVDFVAHEVFTHKKENEDFSEALKSYKKNNPQFLRSNKIEFNRSSADFENRSHKYSSNQQMNDFFRGKINRF